MKLNRLLIAAIPLVFVNVIAVSGQLAFMRADWHWPVVTAAGAAIAIESIAVYLAYMAHEALMAEDMAYGLRLSSYGMGALAGLMNYSHYANPHWQPSSKAVVLAILSALSPWLWAIYTKRTSRDELKRKGLTEPRAVKLGSLRWILWPVRAFHVFRNAVWEGISNPATAIAKWETHIERERAERETLQELMTLDTASTKADRVRVALRDSGATDAPQIAAWLAEHGHTDVSLSYIRTIMARHARDNALHVATVTDFPRERARGHDTEVNQ